MISLAMAVAQSIRAFAQQAEEWEFESQQRHPRSYKQVVKAALPNARQYKCECHVSSEMTIVNGCPVSQRVWHTKEPPLLNGHKC